MTSQVKKMIFHHKDVSACPISQDQMIMNDESRLAGVNQLIIAVVTLLCRCLKPFVSMPSCPPFVSVALLMMKFRKVFYSDSILDFEHNFD